MSKPYFSILIPTFNRPDLLTFSIESVLRQDFTDFEIIVSNNGANLATRAVVKKYLTDVRVKYIENEQVLNMVAHWDKLGGLFNGRYFLITTDRCMLKQGTLSFLFSKLNQENNQVKIITWPWDLYLDKMNILLPCSREHVTVMTEMDSTEYLKGQAKFIGGVDYPMPRGMNSCVEGIFYKKLINRYGSVFRSISPDVTFSYFCLMNSKSFWYVNRALFISQGVDVSNGGHAYVTTLNKHIATLKIDNPFKKVPCKVPFLVNTVAEDFLRTAMECSRLDIYNAFCKTNYYSKLLSEWDAKFVAHKMTIATIFSFRSKILAAMKTELPEVRRQVTSQRRMKWLYILLLFIRRSLVDFANMYLGDYLNNFKIKRILRNGDGVKLNNVYEAAGFFSGTDRPI